MTQDYNPDREGHHNHKYYVRNATRRSFDTLSVDGKNMKFNREGRMLINDVKMAREIQKEYPDDLAVTRVTYDHPSDRGRKYFHQIPTLPWHKELDE